MIIINKYIYYIIYKYIYIKINYINYIESPPPAGTPKEWGTPPVYYTNVYYTNVYYTNVYYTNVYYTNVYYTNGRGTEPLFKKEYYF